VQHADDGYSTGENLKFEKFGVESLNVHGRCRGLKVVPMSSQGHFMFTFLNIVLLKDVSFRHNIQRHTHRQTALRCQ